MLRKLRELKARTVIDLKISELREIVPDYMPIFPDDAKIAVNFFGGARYEGTHFQLPHALVHYLTWKYKLPQLSSEETCRVFRKFGIPISDVQVTRILGIAASNLLRWTALNPTLKLEDSGVNPAINFIIDATIGKLENGTTLVKNIRKHYTREGLLDSIEEVVQEKNTAQQPQ